MPKNKKKKKQHNFNNFNRNNLVIKKNYIIFANELTKSLTLNTKI